MNQYNVVIIGGGPAGLNLAYPLKVAGLKVAVVEENLWGGTCPNRGCDPKKVLISAVEAQAHTEYMYQHGIENVAKIDWPALMAYEKTFTAPVSKSSKNSLIASEIDAIDGHASFIDEHQLKVGNQVITSDKFVIATGQRPRRLTNIKNESVMKTSTDFLKMDDLPKEIAFVGGGYIAFELAKIASAAGSIVHIIHHDDHPLGAFYSEYIKDLINENEKHNIHMHYNIDIREIETKQNQYVLKDDNGFQLKVDRVFTTAGRVANDDTLNLDKIGVNTNPGGIEVNDHMQTNVKNIYAMGDVVAKRIPKLTPVASFEAQYLAQLLTDKSNEAIQYPVIPTIVYGMPKVAQVGVQIQVALENSDKYEVNNLDTTNWFTYRRLRDPLAKVSVVRQKSDGKVVGAAMISSEADVLINEFTFWINHGGMSSEVLNQIFAYPTVTSDLKYM